MTDLAMRQRSLLAALKGRIDHTNASTSYARNLVGSPHVHLLQEIVFWWRSFGIARYCRFTTSILRRRKDSEGVLAAFIRDCPGSPFIEEQGNLFLSYVARDSDPLLAAIAATELALIRSHTNPEAPPVIVPWRHDPEAVFAFLLNGSPFQDAEVEGSFEVRITPGTDRIEWYAAGNPA